MEGEGDTGTSDILKPSADTGFVLAAFPKLKVSSLKPLQSPICLDRPQSRKLQAGNPSHLRIPLVVSLTRDIPFPFLPE